MGKVVCVTGASGYVASWLVKLLLHRGYTVKATVRSLDDPSKVSHLKALEGATERLQFFEANLNEQGSFDAAVDGCDGVFHTASPVLFENVSNPQVELLEPAVKGTISVLSSCLKVPSVKRVVLTSSMASAVANRRDKTSGDIEEETWFSEPEFCEEIKAWYMLSKTLAEEAAIKFARENGMDLVVINPGLVIGPLLQQTMNFSSDSFLSLITEGKSDHGMPGDIFVFVDVRDVGDAHILAFENPSAYGRYFLVAEVVYNSKALNILRRLYPNVKLPESSGEDQHPETPPFRVSCKKAKSLGIKFISLEQSMKDTVESLKERNLINLTL